MGHIRNPSAVKLICGMIAADASVGAEAAFELERLYGPIDLRSEWIPFTFSDYYRAEMGECLMRQFVSFAEGIDAGRLGEIKLATNALEERFAADREGRPVRRVNLDPGYVTPAKLVLATTKDFAHRIYLGQGIFAEVTLNFTRQGCTFFNWTYPDYRTEPYTRFLREVRRMLLASAVQSPAAT